MYRVKKINESTYLVTTFTEKQLDKMQALLFPNKSGGSSTKNSGRKSVSFANRTVGLDVGKIRENYFRHYYDEMRKSSNYLSSLNLEPSNFSIDASTMKLEPTEPDNKNSQKVLQNENIQEIYDDLEDIMERNQKILDRNNR